MSLSSGLASTAMVLHAQVILTSNFMVVFRLLCIKGTAASSSVYEPLVVHSRPISEHQCHQIPKILSLGNWMGYTVVCSPVAGY